MVQFRSLAVPVILATGTVAKPLYPRQQTSEATNITVTPIPLTTANNANLTAVTDNTANDVSNSTVVYRWDTGFDDTSVRILKADETIPELTVLDPSSTFRTLGSDNTTIESISELEPWVPELNSTSISSRLMRLARRYIIGVDDRELYVNPNWPWRNVGRLYWSNGVVCSGSLVGPRHMLTAKHCVVSGATAQFAPGFDNGTPFGAASVTNIIVNGIPGGNACGVENDWAIMILDQDFGTTLGYFGIRLPNPDRMGWDGFTTMGYPGDLSDTMQPYRVLRNELLPNHPWDCDAYGPLYTNTDVSGGQSGGPLWERYGDQRYIWGSLSVGITNGVTAWAGWASGTSLINTIAAMRVQYP